MNSALFQLLPMVLMILHIFAYLIGITLGILGIQALRKYLRD